MKMILVVMPTHLSDLVSKDLLDHGYGVTKFASTSGFLTGGTTTLLVVVDSEKIDPCLALIKENIPTSLATDPAHARVTIYVLKVKDFESVQHK